MKHPVRPEYADGLMALVHEFTAATRAETGIISFDWYRSADDPKAWLLVEAFVDQDAGRAMSSQRISTQRSPRCRNGSDVPEIVHEAPGSGWSRMSEIQIDPWQPIEVVGVEVPVSRESSER